MSDRNNPSAPFSNKKVVDLKPRGERGSHSQFISFTPDDELLQATARVKSQRDIILSRIEKMQSSQNRVSKSVFEKVQRDYGLQLETISEMLADKKKILKEEIKKLYVSREKLSFEINRHREILEEANFRHFLGEFTQSQYQEVEHFESKEIEKLEADLSHIAQWIRTHEELFDPEDFGGKRAPAAPAGEVTKTAAVAPQPERPQQAPMPAEPEARAVPPAPKVQPPAPTAETPAPVVPQSKQQVPAPQPEPPAPAPQVRAPITPPPAAPVPPKAQAPEKAPAAEVLQKTQKDLTPAVPESKSESDTDLEDFSFLFEEDEAQPAQEVPAEGAESRIDDLLSEPAAAPTQPAPQPQRKDQAVDITQKSVANAVPAAEEPEAAEFDIPEPGEDYFSQGKVSESSYTAAPQQEEESVTVSKDAKELDDNRKVLTPDPAKPVSRDESISNILDSIHIEGDEEKAKASQPQETPAAAATGMATEFKLTLLQGDLDQSVYAVGENTSIGRSPSNDVVLKEPKVSRQHAAINKYNEHYIIIDLKSSNGVYVNGTKVDECVLHPGDEISIGGYKFLFERT